MTSMPLTLSRTLAHGACLRLFEAPHAALRRGPAAEPSCSDQLWQSSGVRGVIFFSAAYLSAAALTIGLMIASSASYQSEREAPLAAVPGVDARPAPRPCGRRSEVLTRPHHAGEAQRVELLLVERQVLQAPAHLLAGHHLALAVALLRALARLRRRASRAITPRMYSTWPTSSFGPVPWPLSCTSFEHVLDDLGVRLGAVLQRQAVVALGAVADVLDVGLGAGPPHAVHLLARVAGGHAPP